MIIKKNLPQVGELVLIKIKKVLPFGAYCELSEYNNIDVYLPIREVASGWIKNIHEFIKESQKDVAKVTFVDLDKKAIDISLKKVRPKEKKDKLNQANMEKRDEEMFKQAIIASNSQSKEEEIKQELSKKFVFYNDLIEGLFEKTVNLNDLNISKEFKEALNDIISKNVKQKIYKVSYNAQIVIFNTLTGINIIKKILTEISDSGVEVTYVGAPNYSFVSEDASYAKAEEKIKAAQAIIEKQIAGGQGTFVIKKEKVS
jgi:translation initiation factor 2 subunit 1